MLGRRSAIYPLPPPPSLLPFYLCGILQTDRLDTVILSIPLLFLVTRYRRRRLSRSLSIRLKAVDGGACLLYIAFGD